MCNFENLINGNKNYINTKYKDDKDNLANIVDNGQKPHTLLFTCCDSRISPAKIFNVEEGELFTCRTIGNIVPKDEDNESSIQSTIEYAVNVLKVTNIVVCGHSKCGAYAALPKQNELSKGLRKWLYYAKKDLDELNTNYEVIKGKDIELEGIKLQLKNLLTYKNIKAKVNSGELSINGAYFDIKEGKIEYLDKSSNSFK